MRVRRSTLSAKVSAVFRIAAAFLVIAALGAGIFVMKERLTAQNKERAVLLKDWTAGDYEASYQKSAAMLAKNPMDYFFLTVHGYSAFQLAFSQITRLENLQYIDKSIFSLRKAALTPESKNDGRLYYVLGKAYYFKGSEYADLSVENLEKAIRLFWDANDTYEYLGLSYARLSQYQKSVDAFKEALERADGASHASVLIALARSYIELDDGDSAESYLTQCIDASKDGLAVQKARILLGAMLRKKGDVKGAEEQLLAALNEAGESAEAHYELGELYLANAKRALARSEWNKANRLDPAFQPAIDRLKGGY